MKKVLIITYYWPPNKGTGTQRCLKFAKHLPYYKWTPIIFTNAEQVKTDSISAEETPENIEVLSVKAWEPYSLYRLFTGRSKKQADSPHLNFGEKPGLRDRFARWVRDNYFIPDARKFWIKPSVRFLSEYLRKNKIDLILTSGPPHSAHLIGLALKQKSPDIKWIADFRDPWLHISSYHTESLSATALQKQIELEKSVLKNADAVITVSNQICEQLKSKVIAGKEKFQTITNSFDFSVLPEIKKQHKKFVIIHAGILYANRSPVALWNALGVLVKENETFRNRFELNLIGKTDAGVLAQIEQAGLSSYLKITDFISHKEALNEMASSDILLVLVNNVPESGGILTGKFFEYLGIGKPIIAIGPEKGDLADIITETNCGFLIDYSDESKMKKAVIEIFSGDYKYNAVDREKYSAKATTENLAKIMETL